MNPVYSPSSSGVPYTNVKGIGYPAGFPMSYAAAAPAYSSNMYPGANPTIQTGYTPGTPYKVSCSPTSGAVPPYSSSPNSYQTAIYPVRSVYPQQSPYAQLSFFLPTARYILHTAPVCSTPSRHPPHHSGAAQRYADDSVHCSHHSSERQRGHHGYGGWDHYGHVSRYPADCPLPNSCRPPSNHCAHVSGSRNAHLQLCAPSVVITCKCLRMELYSHILDILQLVLQASCLNQDFLLNSFYN
uniref:Family with sequence similarity 168 member B n=1 Tax=Pipistrellus kuhlii TaxID=59472 RepID=A0A7J7ZIT1_PIPKU|nr:family with sequence similarity 168 member B [Pipistrellus kuhlii]